MTKERKELKARLKKQWDEVQKSGDIFAGIAFVILASKELQEQQRKHRREHRRKSSPD